MWTFLIVQVSFSYLNRNLKEMFDNRGTKFSNADERL
jgi:hypothetical protein